MRAKADTYNDETRVKHTVDTLPYSVIQNPAMDDFLNFYCLQLIINMCWLHIQYPGLQFLLQVVSVDEVNYLNHNATIMKELEAAGCQIPEKVDQSKYRKWSPCPLLSWCSQSVM